MTNDDVMCVGCGYGYLDTEAEDWCAAAGVGFVCITCQYDACAHFGQIRGNIMHTRMFHDLVKRYLTEEV